VNAPDDITELIAPLTGAGPLTVAVMVTSADGRATVEGRVGELTGEADQRVLLGVRELASALVVGGNTVRNEGYAELLGPEAQARRQARGLEPEPELLVMSHTGAGLPAAARRLEAPERADGQPDMSAAWAAVRERHPGGLIVCEGGPSVLTLLAQQRVLDQLILCISPKLVSGDGKRLIEPNGSTEGFPAPLEPLAVAGVDGFVFIRYAVLP
jgi:riboflavin biosynthesis pyrimidine reductase